MNLVDTHLTPILGLDIHFTTSWNPFHPFIGFVMDPMDYIPFIGATVNVNGFKRGVSDTQGIIIPLVHFPIVGAFIMAPIIGHDSMNFFGAERIYAEGSRLSGKGYFVMTCNDIGIPLTIQPGHKKFWHLIPTIYAPTSYSLPIPYGSPVNIGDPLVPDWAGMLKGLAMSFGFGAIMHFARKGMNKLLKKLAGKDNSISKKLCQMGFEPINLVNGSVLYEGTDFAFQGIMPLEWRREWSSDNDYVGILGHGCQNNYDLDVILDPEEDAIGVRIEDGRVLGFPMLSEGEDAYIRSEHMTLRRGHDAFETYDHTSRITKTYSRVSSAETRRWRLKSIRNVSGHIIQLQYEAGKLKEITDTAGRKLRLEYDDCPEVRRVVLLSADGHADETLVEYSYNEAGDMIGVTDAMGKTTHIEYENHLMVSKTDRDGQTFYWQYQGEGKQARCVHTWGEGGYQEGWIEYHTEEGYNAVVNGENEKTIYRYTPEQLVTSVEDELGVRERYEYTEYNEIYRKWDGEDRMTGYCYDERGNLTGIVHPDGTEETRAYDDEDRLITETDALGNHRVLVYHEPSDDGTPINGEGQLSAVIEEDNRATFFEYDTRGLLSSVSLDDRKIHLEYNDQKNLVSVKNEKGVGTQWDYDHKGNVLSVLTSAGARQTFRYDRLNRVVSITTGKRTTNLRYNSYEDVVEASEGPHHVKYKYSPMGDILQREGEDGSILRFAYDRMDRLRMLTNEYGEEYTFDRNLRGEIVGETGFDSMHRSYMRDCSGRVIREERAGGRWTEYEYDQNGRLTRSSFSDGTIEVFGYDALGRLTEARNATGSVGMGYDEGGRVVRECFSGGLPDDRGTTVENVYDELGNRIETRTSLGSVVQNSFDEDGLLSRVAAACGGGESWEEKIVRDSEGLRIEKIFSGGIRMTRTYDAYGNVVSQKSRSLRQEGYDRRYAWNASGRLQSAIDGITGGKTTYAYDAVGSLMSAHYEDSTDDYRMPDAVGNVFRSRDRSDREYGRGGRILRDRYYDYLYDVEGNLILKTPRRGLTRHPNHEVSDESGTHIAWQTGDYAYEWYGNGMLKEVRLPYGKTVRFEYDALGRRTAKLFKGRVFRYLWDGNVMVQEWQYDENDRPQHSIDEFGRIRMLGDEPVENLVTWVYEEGSYVPVAKIQDGERYTIISDYMGRPVEAYNSYGTIVWQGDYDIYGNLRNRKGIRDFIPFRQLGQYEDDETGLYYNRFRYYDSRIGNYISQDPIRLMGNNPTLYGYVEDCNVWFDIFGLYLHRPYIRKETRIAIEKSGTIIDGRFYDTVDGMDNAIAIEGGKRRNYSLGDGEYHLGHKEGHEYRYYKEYAEKKGMTQKEFNDLMNNPAIYQIEDPHTNMSHVREAKANPLSQTNGEMKNNIVSCKS
ncbi:GH-E family nuclease [Prevotella intermedia]|uniref:GH-E family nuclease n=1 Tax=Prevotella intermedia TaxID=28131 RepID=UPI00397C3A60